VTFRREVALSDQLLRVRDSIELKGNTTFSSLQIGDEFFVRYVPQSAYFQSQEFDAKGFFLSEEQLAMLNEKKSIVLEHTVDLKRGTMGNLIVIS